MGYNSVIEVAKKMEAWLSDLDTPVKENLLKKCNLVLLSVLL